jgi:arylsulfatase
MRMTAQVDVPEGGAEGVIFALGGDAAGFALFLWDGKVRYHYNFFGIERYDATAASPLSAGSHTIEVDFAPDAPIPGCPATATVSVDGQQVADVRVERQIPLRCGTECFDVGQDSRSPVCEDYADRGLFEFTGAIGSVRFRFGDAAEPSGMDRLEMATKLD